MSPEKMILLSFAAPAAKLCEALYKLILPPQGGRRTYNKEEYTMATRKMTDRAAEAWLSEPVTVHLFRDNGSYKEDKIVTVNGETVRIPRGEDVTIARRFALVLAQGEAQDARTGALIERETARFAAESGALGL